ncbi:glycoside hydrolase family 13 protein [Carnimonas nigrificans]|uniref:glycoside hydrolase family 13 protein n=1 Tax=Carnimonas nigrificans TaxID=64323 RepID=UPI00046F6817|nr:glycoside hydrolase family 13 protein [Carnimonas nigrificans]
MSVTSILSGNKENNQSKSGSEWWRSAVIYQIYPRSFADANGDGMGDLKGITERLPYLARLGVDAIWLSPFYKSPQADAGYDVADYRQVDPLFGTLDDFDAMLDKAHASGLRVLVDLVPNHSSDEHEWFKAALASPEGSPERERYMFRDGKGENGELPPNNWQSVFGGDAWTRPEGQKQWYLHIFDTKQPDFNWQNPEVRAEFESVLRFWLDRGVDGFRVDVAHGLVKEEGLPDFDEEYQQSMVEGGNQGPMWDQDGVHDIYRDWRKVLNEYDGDRMMVAEAWVKPQERLALYIRSDEMQQAFNFDYLLAHWDAAEVRHLIDESLAQTALAKAPTTWVMSNHDSVRHTSRFGLSNPGDRPNGIGRDSEQPDEALGLQRARAFAFVTFFLPGAAYIYQGEELGLPEHTTMEDKYRQDPTFWRTKGEEIGRDGCRVPLPWKADAPAFGFGPSDQTWLPQPQAFARYAVDVEEADSDSTLALYRKVLEVRAEHHLGQGELEWLDAPAEDTLLARNGDVYMMVNFGESAVKLPWDDAKVLAASHAQSSDSELDGNTGIWFQRG